MLTTEERMLSAKERIETSTPEELGTEANLGIDVDHVISELARGTIRVAVPGTDSWKTNAWIKKAIRFYFLCRSVTEFETESFYYRDKVPLKSERELRHNQVRMVPGAICRHGAFVGEDVVCMPSFINVGAYVDERTMVDTWATVGSCAQIGKDVHLSGGVGIGGVLEPEQAQPVIIEDNCFIGSRSMVLEGAHIRKEAVLGANVVITASTPIIDVREKEPVYYTAEIPERAVVIPGSLPKQFPAGTFNVPCALIVGTRKESTNKKTALNEALRENAVSA